MISSGEHRSKLWLARPHAFCWESRNQHLDWRFELSGAPGHGFVLRGLVASRDGTRLVSATYSDIRVWDLRTDRRNPRRRRAENYVDDLADDGED